MNSLEWTLPVAEGEILKVDQELTDAETVRAPIATYAELDLASLVQAPLSEDVSSLVVSQVNKAGSSGS